jgi:WD40 repeat protein
MNFSVLLPYQQANFSHNGNFLAISKGSDLFIYDADTLQIKRRFVFQDEVQKIKWSPDDNFLMVVNLKTNTVHLRCINEEVIEAQIEGWSGLITEDMLAGAAWSSDSR